VPLAVPLAVPLVPESVSSLDSLLDWSSGDLAFFLLTSLLRTALY
jgi:hypothetical protein